MNERFFLIILILCSACYAYFGLQIEVPFAYDPLGPRTFPVVLGCGLLLLCVFLFLQAGNTEFVQSGRVGKLALAVLFYLAAWQFLGFMLATSITVYSIARVLGSSWMQGLLTGLVIAISFYGIFHFLLQVPLPLGNIFRVIG